MNFAADIVAIDIGSTRVRYGRGTTHGPHDVSAEPTRADELEAQVVEIVERVRTDSPNPITGVSVSTTGLVDTDQGVIREFDTADGRTLHDIDLRVAVENAYGLPLTVKNDCTAAAIGESQFGDGRGYSCVAHVTFGTGIGAGVVEDGRPVTGEHGYATEVGLFPIKADGTLESSGVKGAWEAYCAGRGIPNFAQKVLESDSQPSILRDADELSAPDVFAAAENGDELAMRCLDQIARYNAAGLGALINAYDPGLITLGGSVALHNAEWLLAGIRDHIDDYVLADPPTIELTPLGSDIELYGAIADFSQTESIAPAVESVVD